MLRMSEKQIKEIKKNKSSSLRKNVIEKRKSNEDLIINSSVKGRLRIDLDANNIVKLEIPLSPRPKERARTFMDNKLIVSAFLSSENNLKKFMGNIQTVMKTMTPESTRAYESAIGLYAIKYMNDNKIKPFECPVELNIEFIYEGNPLEYPTSQGDGDLDNLEKALLDGMNKVVYLDDKLVVKKTAIKRCDKKSKIIVEIKPYSN
jgi:Holliday junction resolvase RusA-like endonuclease